MNTIYFSKLYPNQADYSKIDLTSLQFYRDTVDLYCQKKSEREKLIRGIKYLSFKIKNEDELNPVLEAWATAMYSFNVREVFAERKHTPNLVTEFKDKVAKILKEREIKIIDGKNKILSQLKEENTNLKITNSSLIKTLKFEQTLQIEPNLTESRTFSELDQPSPIGNTVSSKVKKGKSSLVPQNASIDQIELIVKSANYKHRNEIKVVLDYLNDNYLCNKDGKDFTAIALILYNTGYFIQISSFQGFKRLLAGCYGRKIPSYKPSQVKETANIIKGKINCLYNLPID